jgi:hypothetical protein
MEIQWTKLGLQVDFLACQVKPLALRFADCQNVLLLESEAVLFDQSREEILPDRVAVDRDNSVVVALWPARIQNKCCQNGSPSQLKSPHRIQT